MASVLEAVLMHAKSHVDYPATRKDLKEHLKTPKIRFLEKCQKECSQLGCFGLVQLKKSWFNYVEIFFALSG
jgi:hypothetical protein